MRGAGKIIAHASRDTVARDGATTTELVLSGILADDAGEPLPSQNVSIRVRREAGGADASVAAGMRGARGCDRQVGETRPSRGPTAWGVRVAGTAENPEVVVITDEDGRFCFRATLEPDRYRADLAWSPKAGGLVDGATRELPFDLSRRALVLRFDPTPRVVRLDAERTSVEVVAIVDDDATPKVAPDLPIVLRTERDEIARATTDATGRARFELESKRLGAPGPGELSVSSAGNADTAGADHVEDIERHVNVRLAVPAADRGELTPKVPEDGIPIVVDVSSVVGPVPEGSVEASVGDVVVGAAPVEQGNARLRLTFTAPGSEVPVKLRYVPASPWYEAQSEPTIRVPIRGPGILSKAPILVAGLAVLAFFLVGRFSGRSNRTEPQQPSEAKPRLGKPRLEVVRAAAKGETGWRGRVIDAHEGTPVANARVWVERGTFEGRSVLVSVSTGDDGSFVLPDLQLVGEEHVGAEARMHARLIQPLPPPGEISIALVERRRALLEGLVKWARRRGAPFDVKPEPTPGHVRRAAADDAPTRQWAEAVERAAFGPDEVDARVEREIDGMTPEAEDAPAPGPGRPDRPRARPRG